MRASFWLIGLLYICGILVLPVGNAAGSQTPLAKVELIKQAPKSGLSTLPDSAPQPVLYFLDKANAPSCGLLSADHGATMITPILETEPSEDFPYCLEITDWAKFKYGGGDGFVFRYRQRDTREDSSTVHFFVQLTANGLQPFEKLNSETPPLNKPIKYMAAWAKFRLVSFENEKDLFRTSLSDSIILESAVLNVSRNATSGICRTAVDWVSTEGHLGPVTTSCNAVLASTSLIRGKTIYFIVLIETEDHRSRGQIYVVEGDTVRKAPELENQLTAEISNRKILKVKESLRKLIESH